MKNLHSLQRFTLHRIVFHGIVAILKFTILVFVVSDFHSFSLTRGKYKTFGRIESLRMKITIEPKGLFVDPPLNHHTKVTLHPGSVFLMEVLALINDWVN